MVRVLRYVGLVLLAVLIWQADPVRLAEVARQADARWLLLGWVLNFPQLGLKAFRWNLLLRWQGIAFGYRRAFLAYFGALLVGFLTPGRVGEAVKAVTLRYEADVPLARALSSVVVDRAFDMYLLLSLGALGLGRFALLGERLAWPTFAAVCAALALPMLLLNARVAAWAGSRAAGLPLLRRKGALIRDKAGQFADGLRALSPRRVAICAVLTVAAYAIFFVQCQCCARALGFTLPWTDLVLLMAATNFISFIPGPPSGLGTRELCLVFFFGRLAAPLPMELAVSFGLTIFLVLFVGGGLIGFACWQWAPIGLRRAREDLRARRRNQLGEDPADGA